MGSGAQQGWAVGVEYLGLMVLWQNIQLCCGQAILHDNMENSVAGNVNDESGCVYISSRQQTVWGQLKAESVVRWQHCLSYTRNIETIGFFVNIRSY